MDANQISQTQVTKYACQRVKTYFYDNYTSDLKYYKAKKYGEKWFKEKVNRTIPTDIVTIFLMGQHHSFFSGKRYKPSSGYIGHTES